MGLGPCFPALVQSAAVAVPEKWDGEQMAEVCGTGFGPCLSAVPGKRVIEASKSVATVAEHEYEFFPFALFLSVCFLLFFALFLSLCVLFSFSRILSHHDVVDVRDLMTTFCKMGRSLTSTKKPDELMCLSCSLALCSLEFTLLCLGCFAFFVLLFYVIFSLLFFPCAVFSFLRILSINHGVADASDLMTTLYRVSCWFLTTKKTDEFLCLPCSLALCSLNLAPSWGLIPSW